ncbi:glycosyltransferase family 2 protein [Paenibacillus doosanensis]|uniref:glycosyltransferase family 2 protein n=1 Tax=Paenibacillus doosanensis TaxID=1229154 RepID=UPI00218031B2|nr:glycosyltransferase family A protein [Paenibacillus doosanensis]MCS7458848.1 glycosyltransferase family 2 protein [Paenibacillus doosanensis]
MIVFILDSRHHPAAQHTQRSLDAVCPDGCQTIFLDANPATVMNQVIAASDDPFFITLYAGETFSPVLLHEMERRMERCPGRTAGMLVKQTVKGKHLPDIPRGPLVWRTDAVRSDASPGFAAKEEFPFESFILLEKQHRLSPAWDWEELSGDGWHPHRRSIPGWRRPEKEWEWVYPALTARERTCPSQHIHPTVTVVICTYNDGDYIRWAICSVFAQTYPYWELIVVDDASDDQTQSRLEPLTAPNVRIIRNDGNRGKSHCLNLALSAARGDWLLELDADDWLAPECLQRLMDHAEGMPGAGAWYADHVEWHERANQELVYGREGGSMPVFSASGLLTTARPLAPRLYRVQVLKELGGWLTTDPFEGRLYEDFQILLRISFRYPVRYVRTPLYHRRLRRGSITHRMSGRYEAWKAWMKQAEWKAGGKSE